MLTSRMLLAEEIRNKKIGTDRRTDGINLRSVEQQMGEERGKKDTKQKTKKIKDNNGAQTTKQ